MNGKIDVAVVGATGAVGEAILSILEERDFPVGQVFPLASPRSSGKSVVFRNQAVVVGRLDTFDFSQVGLGLFSAGGGVSAEYVPRAAAAGCVVVDNTSHFRNEPEIPLVVPEVNLHALDGHQGIIANPNCSTIQLVVALKPIYDAVGIRRVNVATYQAVSGAGKKAIEELAGQTADLLGGKKPSIEAMPKQIAFNVIPEIDDFQDNGYTREEMKLVWETRKILEDDSIMVNPTTVRVPVFFGHSEAVHLETREPITALEVRDLLSAAPGVSVIDERKPGGYPTAVTEAANQDGIFVGRIREDISCDRGVNLWIVANNIRKGAALNSVQISEALVRGNLMEASRSNCLVS
jgi:aspartate-semialdehyde dehydrogenase